MALIARCVVALTLACASGAAADDTYWTPTQLSDIKRLSLASLQPLRPDPTNRVADDPRAAVLGAALFVDSSFSADRTVACASCHQPDRQFQDDLPRGKGIGTAGRRTMPLAGVGYYPFLFWDGRKDSLWSQALGPMENPAEHGADRVMIVQIVAETYRAEFEEIFGPLPDLSNLPAHGAPEGSTEAVAAWASLTDTQREAVNLTFANLGKAIEAFERTIPVPRTRFDDYADALAANDEAAANAIFTEAERNGLKLFLGQGDCQRCHSGPLLTDTKFHNIGLPGNTPEADNGRDTAAHQVKDDPFNCLGAFSDATAGPDCFQLNILRLDMPNQVGAFKSPSLRGVAQRPPYMHSGQFATLHEVMVHYNDAPKAKFGTSDLPEPRKLTETQLAELEAFLRTLDVKGVPGE